MEWLLRFISSFGLFKTTLIYFSEAGGLGPLGFDFFKLLVFSFFV